MNGDYSKALKQLQFSTEAKSRMTSSLVHATSQKQPKRVNRRFVLRGALGACVALLVVVALSMGTAGGAYATVVVRGVGGALDDLFGGVPVQTQIVDKIGKPLGASATSAGVSIIADTIIGDRENYVAIFDIKKDDGSAFDGIQRFDKDTLPLGFEGASGMTIDGELSGHGGVHFYQADPTSNTIQCAFQMSVNVWGDSIIGHTARVDLSNLKRYNDDGTSTTIAQGTWKMKFKVNYADTAVDLPSNQALTINGMDATMNTWSLSPVALSLHYTVNEPLVMQNKAGGKMSDEDASMYDRFLDVQVRLIMKDGTTIEASSKGGGSTESKDQSTLCTTNIMFDKIVDVDQVASVDIGNTTIKLA